MTFVELRERARYTPYLVRHCIYVPLPAWNNSPTPFCMPLSKVKGRKNERRGLLDIRRTRDTSIVCPVLGRHSRSKDEETIILPRQLTERELFYFDIEELRGGRVHKKK